MVLNRKFIIWLISFGVVLTAFLIYRSASDTGVIEVTRLNRGLEYADVNQFIADSNAGQVGQAKVEYLERARFETVDVKTRKLKRVVGFEKVLHKTGNEWVLEKPYMNVFQDRLRCDVTAETGTVELENVEGSDPVPKSAVLKGNVVIHIFPERAAGSSDSFVYLHQVIFDSDRSMFFSDDDVNFVSADAHLVGKGLEVVYNSITSRMEYLKVRQVDFLNVRDLAQTSRVKEKQPEETSAAVSLSEPVEAQPATGQVKEKKESYQCLFRDNVSLEYEDEVVLAGEIAIANLLWSSTEESEQPQISTDAAEPNTAGQRQDAKATAPDKKESAESIIATVKCDGPMIIRPTPAAGFDDYKPVQFKTFYKLPKEIFSWLGRRNVLLAQRVSYDYTAEIARAHGQVELVFYPEMKEYAAKRKDAPFIIDALTGAEFISEQNRAVFYGNVKGSFRKQTDYYDEENIFRGDKLIVDLASGQNKPKSAVSADIAHVTVTGPGVRLESIRTLEGTKLSHVRLKSARIDYDRITEDIIATGKGIIEYGSTAASGFEDLSSKSALDRPCYALVEGFDRLVWDTNSLQVKAFSDKSKGIHIGYLPVEKAGYGNGITIDTRQIDIDYFEPTRGRAQLKQLFATGGIVYYEQPRYEFVGKDLYYDAQKNYLTVNGSEDMPCMLNGMFADAIEYNLKTGSASAVLGRGVGIMPVKE